MTLPGLSHSCTITKWLWLSASLPFVSVFFSSAFPGLGVKNSNTVLLQPRICFWSLKAGKTHNPAICCRLRFTFFLNVPSSKKRFSTFRCQLYSCTPNHICPFDDKKLNFSLRLPLNGFHFISFLLLSPYCAGVIDCCCMHSNIPWLFLTWQYSDFYTGHYTTYSILIPWKRPYLEWSIFWLRRTRPLACQLCASPSQQFARWG